MTDHGSTNGAHGGVGHLLRMAKTQCGVSLAFAALRKPEGGFAIATFPALAADPAWSIEAIDELVRQTWDDPNLSGGNVLVRSARVLTGMWTGQGQHIKLAAAALSDPEAPEHPWGLLCVAEPLAGHFEQDQLNLLGQLALRLTAYLRARQQVLEGLSSFEQTEVSLVADPGVAPVSQAISETTVQSQRGAEGATPVPVAPLVMAPPGAPPSSPQAPPEERAFEEFFEEPEDEHPLDRAADATAEQEPWDTQGARRSDQWEFLGLEEIDWVEAAAPPALLDQREATPESTGVEPEPGEDAWSELEAPENPVLTDARSREAPTPSATSGFGNLDAMLGPDPVTGLATLTGLVGRLSSSLAALRNSEGTSVGLIVLEVSAGNGAPELGTTALLTVAGRLTNHVRDRDLVARIGPNLFALLVELRPESVELGAIRERAVSTLTRGAESSSGGLLVRSAMAAASDEATTSAEELIRSAAEQLGPQ